MRQSSEQSRFGSVMAGLDPMGIRLRGQREEIVPRIHFGLVMPGLDPGIHAAPRDVTMEASRRGRRPRQPVDARVIPGLDPGTGHDVLVSKCLLQEAP
jgi:hypothetical protein